MQISDLPVRQLGNRSSNSVGMIPIAVFVKGDVSPRYTWRTINEAIPKGWRLRGIGFLGVECSPLSGILVPSFVEVNPDLYAAWKTILWDLHEIIGDTVGIHFRSLL